METLLRELNFAANCLYLFSFLNQISFLKIQHKAHPQGGLCVVAGDHCRKKQVSHIYGATNKDKESNGSGFCKRK